MSFHFQKSNLAEKSISPKSLPQSLSRTGENAGSVDSHFAHVIALSADELSSLLLMVIFGFFCLRRVTLCQLVTRKIHLAMYCPLCPRSLGPADMPPAVPNHPGKRQLERVTAHAAFRKANILREV